VHGALLPINSVGESDHEKEQDNLKQIGLAFANYESSNAIFPLGAMTGVTSAAYSGWGTQLNNNGVSWVALTLPYLEQNSIFSAINFQEHIMDP